MSKTQATQNKNLTFIHFKLHFKEIKQNRLQASKKGVNCRWPASENTVNTITRLLAVTTVHIPISTRTNITSMMSIASTPVAQISRARRRYKTTSFAIRNRSITRIETAFLATSCDVFNTMERFPCVGINFHCNSSLRWFGNIRFTRQIVDRLVASPIHRT